MKMLITLELHGIFGSNFAYLFILTFPATGMQYGEEALPSIILTSPGLLVKKLITLELHHIF